LRWEVNNITRAVVLLGFEEVSRLVLIYQMKQRVFALSADQRTYLETLWKHSVATAAIARMLALFVDFRGDGREFTAGLMHDLGKIVLVQYFPDTLNNTQSMIRELGMKDTEAELQTLAIDHAEIGGQLAERWGIPPSFVEVMRYHHVPLGAKSNQQLVALSRFSDLLSERWGSGINEQPMTFNLEDDDSWKMMRKSFPRLADERADAVEQKLLAMYEMNQDFVRMFS
jgi:putative nucleotidyltransferase with HDIG domain